jgi:Yip1 domain
MDLVSRAKGVLVNPKSEWEIIKGETISNNDLFTKYALLLAAIPAVCQFIGYSIFGFSLGPFGYYSVPIEQGVFWMVLYYTLTIGGVYLVAFIMDTLAPSFGSTKNMNASLKTVVFSYTAIWIAGVFHIIPYISILSILGLYSLYLLYIGMGIVKEVPKDKLLGYFIVLIIVSIVVYIIIGAIVSGIVFAGAYMGTGA